MRLRSSLLLALVVTVPFLTAAQDKAAVLAAVPFAADFQEPAWPRPIGLAASWDPDLVREVHAEIAARARARGARLVVGPSLEVARDPRMGRMERTFGADPHLVAELGVAAIRGLQGDGGPRSVLAAVSGLAGPGSPRPGTDVSPAPTSERELREVYFPPFEAAVRRAGVVAVIAARNDIDGVPSSANAWLLKDLLRGEWGFTGAVLADHAAVADLHRVHRVAAGEAQAAALARQSGIDAMLDTARSASRAQGRDALPRLAPVALRAARRSIVLLKNEGLLPLADSSSRSSRATILVIEPEGAGAAEALRARLSTRADVAAATDPARAESALQSLKRAGKPVVVVLAGDLPDLTVKLSEDADALIGAWGLGEPCGDAAAAVLTGEVNPGGKLPFSLARNPGQWPMFHDVKPSARRGYLFDTTEPLYPFGFGLGYAPFELGAPRLSAASIGANGSVQVAVDVRNAGKREGEETVQLYVRDKVSSVARPVKSLRDFTRVRLAAGESRTVTFTLAAASLAMWDGSMRRVVEPGEFEVMAGADSTRLKSATLTVLGEAR